LPFDSNGNHSLPAGYQAVKGQTIQATQHNPPLEDLSAALSQTLVRDGRAAMTGDLNMGEFGISNMRAAEADDEAVNKAQMDQSLPPIGIVMDYAGATAPTGWLLCYGQAISRTTYASLFAVIGTVFGVGDGSTTFNLPDARGRVIAGKDNMGGTAASRLTTASGGVAGTTLGAVGGSETHTLTTAQIPAHIHTGTTGSSGNHSHTVAYNSVGDGFGSNFGMSAASGASTKTTSTAGAHTHTFTTDSGGGTGGAHANVQPTMVLNKIIRAL
jgi:microcystin-dependent protein